MTMQTALTVIFWSCFAVIAWVYFGYPAALRCNVFGTPCAKREGKPKNKELFCPEVSVIVAAHNEECGIETKLRNLIESDYPRHRMEILVGSDGSSDRTEEIVSLFRDQGVGLLSFPRQRGKSAIQNGLVAAASGSVLVFTDADCLLPRDAISCLVQRLGDPGVGLVTGAPRYRNAGETSTTANEGPEGEPPNTRRMSVAWSGLAAPSAACRAASSRRSQQHRSATWPRSKAAPAIRRCW